MSDKYQKLIVLFKPAVTKAEDIVPTTSVEFENVTFSISDGFFIINEHKDDDNVIGKIFPLKEVHSYKTIK